MELDLHTVRATRDLAEISQQVTARLKASSNEVDGRLCRPLAGTPSRTLTTRVWPGWALMKDFEVIGSWSRGPLARQLQ